MRPVFVALAAVRRVFVKMIEQFSALVSVMTTVAVVVLVVALYVPVLLADPLTVPYP